MWALVSDHPQLEASPCQNMPNNTNDASQSDNTPRHKAFTRAFEELNGYFYRYYCRKFRDPEVAKDVCQDFWLSVYRRIPTEKLGEIGLLKARAREIGVDYIRRKSTRAFVEFHGEVLEVAGAVAVGEADSAAAQELFWSLVPDVNLTQQQKSAFWMNRRLGYTIEQISQKLSVPVSTIGGWISRAMAECKRSLNKET